MSASPHPPAHTDPVLDRSQEPVVHTLSPEAEALVRRFSLASLAPFVVLAVLIWLVRADLHPFVAFAMQSWGVAVAASLGGLHWGAVLSRVCQPGMERAHLLGGAALAMFAWVGAVMPAYAGLPLIGLVLIASYLMDRRWWPGCGWGRWLTLRFRLSALAAFCCFFAAGAT